MKSADIVLSEVDADNVTGVVRNAIFSTTGTLMPTCLWRSELNLASSLEQNLVLRVESS
jgi:hypothetical protein